MAKQPVVNTISSGYASQSQLNENFSNIQTSFNNTLSLDGSTPNAMQADFDMNNQDIINIGSFQANQITIGGSSVDLGDIQTLTGLALDIQTLADIEDGTVATDAISDLASVYSSVEALAPSASGIVALVPIADDIATVASNAPAVSTVATNISDVNNFASTYRISSTDPSVSLDIGDLVFNTSDQKMKVYNGAAWQDVAPVATSFTVSQITDLSTSATELNYTDGVTSSIQDQLDTKVDDSQVGTGPNQIVQLNGSSQLPAVDGSQLTGIGGVTVATLMKFGAL